MLISKKKLIVFLFFLCVNLVGWSHNVYAKKKVKSKKTNHQKHYIVGSFIGLVPLLDFGVTMGYSPKGNKHLGYFVDFHRTSSPFAPMQSTVISGGIRSFFGSFYLGTGLGKISGLVEEEDEKISNTKTVERDAYVMVAHIGNLWRFGSGFTFGMQWLGLDFPIAKVGDYEESAPAGLHSFRVELGANFK